MDENFGFRSNKVEVINLETMSLEPSTEQKLEHFLQRATLEEHRRLPRTLLSSFDCLSGQVGGVSQHGK